jgi:peptidoglycan/xylan/chitin deacetylase (PgdA/CDA1 family)
MKDEILLAQQQMYDLLGYQTNLFRLPYGTYNEEALNVIGENGLYAIQWDDVSGDPDPNIDAQRMTNGVLQHLQSGSIIIMHANGRGWHTAEALPGIIQSIRQQGYTLVTVSDLLQIQPYK